MTTATTEKQNFNISELAKGFRLDRATVKKRIEDAGIEPTSQRSKETCYRLTPELETALLAADDSIDAEKLRKLKAEADLKEMEAARQRGELVPADEFTEIVQQLFGALHKELAVRLPKRFGAKAKKAKTPAEVSAALAREVGQVFDSLRDDWPAYLDPMK